MTDRLAHMSAEDLGKLIEYITRYDVGKKTVGGIKKELGLTEEEYNELYTLSMPAIRKMNDSMFWSYAYSRLETKIRFAIGGKKSLAKKLEKVADILEHKSIRMLKAEHMKGDVA